MDYYKRALELNDETIKNRRYFHMNAEAGLHMPMACVYVMDKLTEYGLVPSRCGEGVTATVGNGGKVLLLRADMDALPMPEESGLPFACPTGKEAHACGHDFHAWSAVRHNRPASAVVPAAERSEGSARTPGFL